MTWFDAFLRTCDIEKHRQFFVTEESTDLASMKEWTDRDLDVLGINKTRRMNKPTHTHLQRRNGGGGIQNNRYAPNVFIFYMFL